MNPAKKSPSYSDGPAVAIAIPIGTWSPTLPLALHSLKQQTSQGFSLAVMDASQDSRVSDALKASGLDISYLRQGRDDGQAAAIAEGWQNTSGEILAWLNVDDMLMPDTVRRVLNHFCQHPETDVYCGQSTISTEAGQILGLHPEVQQPGPLLMRSNLISQPSCFFRKNAVDAIGGINTKLEYTMDWDLWVRLYSEGANFVQTDKILSNVTWAKGTKTSEFSLERLSEIYGILRQSQSRFSAAKGMWGLAQHYGATYLSKQSNNITIQKRCSCPANLTIMNATKLRADQLDLAFHFSPTKLDCVTANARVTRTKTGFIVKFKNPVESGNCVQIKLTIENTETPWLTGAKWTHSKTNSGS
jgi:hypothetical protein